MAAPPTIPTSFVPHSAASSFRRSDFDFGGAFMFIGFGALFIACSVAGAIVAYSWFLSNIEETKREELITAKDEIDTLTVESLVSLNRRITEGERLLNNHQAVSKALDLFERIIPTTVQFTSFSVKSADTKTNVLTANGIAPTLNALAAFSLILGKEGQINNALLSGKALEKTAGIGFTMTAGLESEFLTFVAGDAVPVEVPEEMP